MEKSVKKYVKIYRKALEENGYFILTDYFAALDEEELLYRESSSIILGCGG